MSLFPTRPSNADQQQTLSATEHDNESEAQWNDRRENKETFTSSMSGSSGGIATDISAAQKMISATWGSILTSLLGIMPEASVTFEKTTDS
jgi:hypothetical protein